MDTKNNQLENMSQESVEIMGIVPHWIFRWGITCIAGGLLMLVIGSWFFKYPDSIKASIKITNQTPPALVSVKSPSTIDNILVSNWETVEKGQVLTVLKSAASYEDLLKLTTQLEWARAKIDKNQFSGLKIEAHYRLGDVQHVFEEYRTQLAEYQHLSELNYHQNMVKMLKIQIEKQEQQIALLNKQIDNYKQDIQLAEAQYLRNVKLLEENLVPHSTVERSKSTLLMKKNNLETSLGNLDDLFIRMSNLNKAILDQQLQQKKRFFEMETKIHHSFELLLNSIAMWEESHLLRAPISGVVSFHDVWHSNQQVKSGDTIMSVMPEGHDGQLMAKMKIPILGSGKVQPGQKVKIMFDSFPHEEYGIVMGTVKSKTMVAVDNEYSVEIDLPTRLQTTFGFDIDVSGDLYGVSQIITEDSRLLTRLIRPIMAVTKNRAPSENQLVSGHPHRSPLGNQLPGQVK